LVTIPERKGEKGDAGGKNEDLGTMNLEKGWSCQTGVFPKKGGKVSHAVNWTSLRLLAGEEELREGKRAREVTPGVGDNFTIKNGRT